MAQKTIKTRIRQKHETAANWEAATGFKPLAGELIVYDAETGHGPRLKIGDESTLAKDLPFVEAVPLAHSHAITDVTGLQTAVSNANAHIASAHAPSNAEKNQNAFSNIKVGSTTVAADTATDTLELVAGSNITLTPDATNDKVTIAASHPSVSKSTDSTSTVTPEHGLTFTAVDAITRDTNGHVTKINTKTITLPDAGLHYISSDDFTTTAGSDTTDAYLAAKWSVPNVDSITVPTDGMSIAFRTPVAGNKGGILLSIDGGANYYPIIRNNTTLVTTTYAVGSTLILTFNSKQATSPYVTAGTATSVTGCWQIADYDANTTYTNVKLGHGYGTCSTAAATVAKTASVSSSYTLTTGGIVAIKFTYDVPANATLNINSKGAKAIYYKGAKIPAGVIKAGDIATFIYSSYYHLISIDRLQDDINSLSAAIAAKSATGHTHGTTTANAAPHTHTHSVTVSGTTGANSGTAVSAVTGYGSFSGGSGSLTSDTTSTNGIKYVEAVSHSAASLTGTKTFNTDAIKDVTLSASSTSTDGPAYVESVTHTAASLTGTKTFVTAQGTFSAGTTPVSSAAPAHTSTASGSSSGTTGTIASYSAGVLTINTTVNSGAHTHTYDKTTSITLTRGTAPSLGAASTGTVGISGGSITPVTKYMKKATTAASTATVGISGGSVSSTTKYLHHAHTAASLGTPSTSSVAPSGHTHSYGSSTALTTGNNSGTAVAAVTAVNASTN